MTIRYLVVAMTLAVFAIPLSAEAQSSFDCRRPRSDTAATICRDPDLAARDRQIDLAYRKALDQAADPDRVRDNRTAWANSLVGCGSDRQCIAQAYAEELAQQYMERFVAPWAKDGSRDNALARIFQTDRASVERSMEAVVDAVRTGLFASDRRAPAVHKDSASASIPRPQDNEQMASRHRGFGCRLESPAREAAYPKYRHSLHAQ